MRNYDDYVSAAVIKSFFDRGCEISHLITHMRLKETKEQISLHKHSRFKNPTYNPPDTKIQFHENCFSLLRGETKDISNADAVALELIKMKKESKKYEINPNIKSKKSKLIGNPDIIFRSDKYTNTVELKDRSIYIESDKIQVEVYMMILIEDGSLDIGRWKAGIPKKEINGFVLYNNGNLVPIELDDRKWIKDVAFDILKNIRKYKFISDLPKPEKCNPICSNIDYCIRNKVTPYENIIASPGGIEVESPVYRART